MIYRRTLLILVILCIPVTCLTAAQFTADFNFESAQTPMQAKIYVSGNMYRLESQMDSEELVLIHKNDAAYIINPALKQYKVIEGMAENFINPIAAWKTAVNDMQANLAAEETLNGYQCKLYEYKYDEESGIVMEIWKADALNFFVKQIYHAADGDAVMTLSNIQESELDPALFEIPEGYTEAVNEQKTSEKKPEQKPVTKTSSDDCKAPWGGFYAAGTKVTVTLDPQMEPNIVIKNNFDGESICKFTSQATGKESKTRTITLKTKSKKEEPFLGFGGIEKISLEVEKGEVFLTVDQEAGMSKDYREDIYFHTYGEYKIVCKSFSVDPARNLAVTIISDSPQASGNIKFTTGSSKDSEDFTLKNGETKSWKYPADKKTTEFEITLTEGAVRFSFRQPDQL